MKVSIAVNLLWTLQNIELPFHSDDVAIMGSQAKSQQVSKPTEQPAYARDPGRSREWKLLETSPIYVPYLPVSPFATQCVLLARRKKIL